MIQATSPQTLQAPSLACSHFKDQKTCSTAYTCSPEIEWMEQMLLFVAMLAPVQIVFANIPHIFNENNYCINDACGGGEM